MGGTLDHARPQEQTHQLQLILRHLQLVKEGVFLLENGLVRPLGLSSVYLEKGRSEDKKILTEQNMLLKVDTENSKLTTCTQQSHCDTSGDPIYVLNQPLLVHSLVVAGDSPTIHEARNHQAAPIKIPIGIRQAD